MISHVGIAVNNLEKSIALYEQMLGRKAGPIVLVPDQKVRVVLFSDDNSGEGGIELLEATSDRSVVLSFDWDMDNMSMLSDDFERTYL